MSNLLLTNPFPIPWHSSLRTVLQCFCYHGIVQTHKFCDNAENNWQSMKNGKILLRKHRASYSTDIYLKFKNYIGDLYRRLCGVAVAVIVDIWWKLMGTKNSKGNLFALLLYFCELILPQSELKDFLQKDKASFRRNINEKI